jgi:hypothetical protein
MGKQYCDLGNTIRTFLVQGSEFFRERREVGVALRIVELLTQFVHPGQRVVKLGARGFLDDAEKKRAQQVVGLLQNDVVVELFPLARAW